VGFFQVVTFYTVFFINGILLTDSSLPLTISRLSSMPPLFPPKQFIADCQAALSPSRAGSHEEFCRWLPRAVAIKSQHRLHQDQ